MENMIRSGDVMIMQLRSVGAAVNDVARDATAYPHREQNFSVLAATVPDRRPQLDKLWAELYAHLTACTSASSPTPTRLDCWMPGPSPR